MYKTSSLELYLIIEVQTKVISDIISVFEVYWTAQEFRRNIPDTWKKNKNQSRIMGSPQTNIYWAVVMCRWPHQVLWGLKIFLSWRTLSSLGEIIHVHIHNYITILNLVTFVGQVRSLVREIISHRLQGGVKNQNALTLEGWWIEWRESHRTKRHREGAKM